MPHHVIIIQSDNIKVANKSLNYGKVQMLGTTVIY
jgi:hypothetical protein